MHRELSVAGADDGDRIGNRVNQVARSGDADWHVDGGACRRHRDRRKQLVAAEARTLPRGKQDADDAGHRISLAPVALIWLLGQQPELAVANRDQHARALVHPVVIRRRHVEHALAADHLTLVLERIA